MGGLHCTQGSPEFTVSCPSERPSQGRRDSLSPPLHDHGASQDVLHGASTEPQRPQGERAELRVSPFLETPAVYTCLPSPWRPCRTRSIIPGAGAREAWPLLPTRPRLASTDLRGSPPCPHFPQACVFVAWFFHSLTDHHKSLLCARPSVGHSQMGLGQKNC